jgi:hypothetical protein
MLSRQANLRGSSSSCTMKPKDRMVKSNQTTKVWRLNSTSPIEENPRKARQQDVKTYLTRPITCRNFDEYKTKTNLSPWVESRMKVTHKTKLDRWTPTYLKILEAARRWRSKKIFDAIHQPEDKKGSQLLEDTPFVCTHEVPSDQAWDDPEECFQLGLTCSLVVKKCRGLSRQI